MSILETLKMVVRAGMRLFVADGKLTYEAVPGSVSDVLLQALRLHKNALLDVLSDDYERGPFCCLVDRAMVDALPIREIPLGQVATVTNPNVFVRWAVMQIQMETHHRMECLLGLLIVWQALGESQR